MLPIDEVPVDEERALHVLASIPPSVLVKSEGWLRTIRGVILHAGPSERKQLIPDGYEIRKVQAPRKQHSLARQKATLKYFSDQGKQPSNRLVELATDLAETKSVLPDYTKVWASSGPVYQSKACETDASQRICGIMQNIDALEKNIELAACAFRLSLLILSHLVEQNILRVENSKLSTGRSRKTIVFQDLAQQNKVHLKKITEPIRRAKRYLLIAEKGGIGSLLVVGSHPTSLEHLSQEEVELLCHYRKNRLPGLQARCEKLNYVAAQLILEGFCMYGWGYSELSKGGNVMDLVGQYVRLDLLASGQIALRLESQSSGEILGKRDADVVQQSSECQARTARTDDGSPGKKRRKLLSGESCSRARGESVTLTATTGGTVEVGIEHLANRIPSFGTDGLVLAEGSGQGVEARSQHASLLSHWPPRWTSSNALDSGLGCGQEAREQTNICSSPKSGGSDPIDHQSPPSMGLARSVAEVVGADTSAPMADAGIPSSSEKLVNDGVRSELLLPRTTPSVEQHEFGTSQGGCRVADFTYAKNVMELWDDDALTLFGIS